MKTNIVDVKTAKECKEYLKRVYKLCESKRLYQYTSCKTLIQMMKTGKFRLV